MKKLIFILLFLPLVAVIFVECDNSENHTGHVIHTKACTIQITGMMCEKGCKTTIQNRITEMEGIVEGEVDYALGKAFITYDANTTSCEDIILEIESIGDGMYGASIVEDKDIENAPIGTDEAGENGSASVSSYSFEIPDITWIFSDLL